MWQSLEIPWQICFEEAWEAYCNGSIPIGAVLVDEQNNIVSRGRNRINETYAPVKQTCGNKLAHAEINVLMQVSKETQMRNLTLYTTTEPCILCFGAIVMCNVGKVRYSAKDLLAGGSNLNNSNNTFIEGRLIDIQCDQKRLGEIQRVLRTDYILRYLNKETAQKLLYGFTEDYPEAVELGKRWFDLNKLEHAKQNGYHIGKIIDEINQELS
ncbi:nucleoside deaminase [Paenibacillus filicis]|uniref:Nucleoside deaminase n=1 Tax=Paenibacillus gyeongsangnamensis TaxID=3388067 RepID=A0ABT4QLK1_9BACL|nr:nucleoside deaminase [Paenibacillus filicis]MCZ8517687.1 nucleoside deaminase [Paenibacillus filicis]